MLKILQVPKRFSPENRVAYPPHQTSPQLEDQAEMFFMKNAQNIQTDLVYCPIKWTAYHIQHDYGKERVKLQQYVNSLPKNQKYFTVVQYDDGLLVDFPECVVFSAGGKPHNSIPIPLVCDRHIRRNLPKKYTASFMGNVKTHPIREKMVEALKEYNDIYIGSGSTENFMDITEQSYFSLCPRGYGKTSFRLFEAMNLGAVPVYLFDDPWIPFQNKVDWDEFCLFSEEDEVDSLVKYMRSIIKDTEKYESMRENAIVMSETLFNYKGTFEVIRGILESDYNKRAAR